MSRQLTVREFRVGKSVVLRATQSPHYPALWALNLNCGHEVWVTQRTKPKLDKLVTCSECAMRKEPTTA